MHEHVSTVLAFYAGLAEPVRWCTFSFVPLAEHGLLHMAVRTSAVQPGCTERVVGQGMPENQLMTEPVCWQL